MGFYYISRELITHNNPYQPLGAFITYRFSSVIMVFYIMKGWQLPSVILIKGY